MALFAPEAQLNLTDGHPRMPLTASQAGIVARLPDFFEAASRVPFVEIEQRAHRALLGSLGQHRAPVGTGRTVSLYSSTVALDVVARALNGRITAALFLHPTFDNIVDVFRSRAIRLLPVTEAEIDENIWPVGEAGALVLVTPNNPTGWVLGRPALEAVAARCAQYGIVLVVDASFRGQDPRAQYDMYATLDASGCEWIVVEDTGKLFPVHELKIGVLSWSEAVRADLPNAVSEVLLSVSPVILQLVTALAEDGASGGYALLQATLRRHRSLVAESLSGSRLHLTDPRAAVGVARVSLPSNGPPAEAICARLRNDGVHLLPCSHFHWARPHEGAYQIRLSLSRPTDSIRRAATALLNVATRRGAFPPQ